MDPVPPDRLGLARLGEDAAARHYRREGYSLVARNWRCGLGEIDLILSRGGVLVFCEVKTRRGRAFGGPFEAVTWTKQRKLRALAEAFLASAGRPEGSMRFDVASVSSSAGGRCSVFVYEAAF